MCKLWMFTSRLWTPYLIYAKIGINIFNEHTGFIMNSVHSREGCYLYLKAVDRGQTEILLGNEEKEALEQALGYKE